MSSIKYHLFKKAYLTTEKDSLSLDTNVSAYGNIYRIEYTIKWATFSPHRAIHERLIRVLMLLVRKAKIDLIKERKSWQKKGNTQSH